MRSSVVATCVGCRRIPFGSSQVVMVSGTSIMTIEGRKSEPI